MVKILFLTALVAASIGAVSSCAPPALQQQYMSGAVPQTNIPAGVPEHYIRQYQQLHRDNPCVQCDAIVAQSSCSNHWHNSQFSCPTPRIAYGLNGKCGQATITCAPDQATGHPMMVVALLDNSDGRFGQNAQVYAPISSLGNGRAVTQQGCTMESTWSRQSMDNFRLAQPLTVQCAHQVDGYVLPPVAERYRSFQQSQPTRPAPQATYRAPQPQTFVQPQQTRYISQPQQTHYVAPPQQAQYVNHQVVHENVEEQILGTTLIPVVRERVVQNTIKEVHNKVIQKKRIIKTKRISKPTQFIREYMERVPATRIVPTFEERRVTKVIRGTTLVPVVEEMEVTEMLPEVTQAPVAVRRPTYRRVVRPQPYRRVVRPMAAVENSAYETVPQQKPMVQEPRVEQGYGESQPQQTGYEQSQPSNYGQQTGYGENSASNGYERSATGSNGYQQPGFSGVQSQGRNQNQRPDQKQPYARPQGSFAQTQAPSTSQQPDETTVPLNASSQQPTWTPVPLDASSQGTEQPLSTEQQETTDRPEQFRTEEPENVTESAEPQSTSLDASTQQSEETTRRPEDFRTEEPEQQTSFTPEQTTRSEDFQSTTRTFSTERPENFQQTRQETEQPRRQESRTEEPENVTESSEPQSTSTQQTEEMTDRPEASKTQQPQAENDTTTTTQQTLPLIEDENQSTSQPERQEFATDQSVVFPAPTKKAVVIEVPQKDLEQATILPIVEEEEPVTVSTTTTTEVPANVTMIRM